MRTFQPEKSSESAAEKRRLLQLRKYESMQEAVEKRNILTEASVLWFIDYLFPVSMWNRFDFARQSPSGFPIRFRTVSNAIICRFLYAVQSRKRLFPLFLLPIGIWDKWREYNQLQFPLPLWYIPYSICSIFPRGIPVLWDVRIKLFSASNAPKSTKNRHHKVIFRHTISFHRNRNLLRISSMRFAENIEIQQFELGDSVIDDGITVYSVIQRFLVFSLRNED